MPAKAKNDGVMPGGEIEEEVTVDMTTAKTLQPLDPKRPYLMAVSAWKYGKSGGGGRKVRVTLAVVEPKEKGIEGRTVTEDISLDNEFTLGRVQTLLLGLGFDKDKLNSKKFAMPHEDDMLGLQATVRVRTRQSETYGDRSVLNSVRPASAYAELAQAAQS